MFVWQQTHLIINVLDKNVKYFKEFLKLDKNMLLKWAKNNVNKPQVGSHFDNALSAISL